MHRVRTLAVGGLAAVAILAGSGQAARAAAAARHPMVAVGGEVTSVRGSLTGRLTVRDIAARDLHRVVVRLSLTGGRRSWSVLATEVATVTRHRAVSLSVHRASPSGLTPGRVWVHLCAGSAAPACRTIGVVSVPRTAASPGGAPSSGSATSTHSTTTTTTTSSTSTRTSTAPGTPIAYDADTPQEVTAPGGVDYWVDVPKQYDATNRTPMKLLVWLHGCGGEASGDIWEVTTRASRDYLAIAGAEREDGCWDVNSDSAKVLADVADVEHHFNVDPRQIILGGYSSGGDLAYRLMFYNSTFFAGLLAENTTPFRDTGSTASQSLAAATRKFPVVHLAHQQDTTYPLQTVQNEIGQMRSAGFAVTLLTRPGDHYDDPGQHGYNGTDPDLQSYLLPHIDDGWLAPGG